MQIDGEIIGFEVLCPREPVILALRKTRGSEEELDVPLPDGRTGKMTSYEAIMYSENPCEFFEWIFTNDKKRKQFERAEHKKILIVDLSENDHARREIFGIDHLTEISCKIPVGCAGIAIVVRSTEPNPSVFVISKNAAYPLNETERQ